MWSLLVSLFAASVGAQPAGRAGGRPLIRRSVSFDGHIMLEAQHQQEAVEACDWQCYLDRYPDLQKAFGAKNTAKAETHYRTHGQKKGRDCTCVQAQLVAFLKLSVAGLSYANLEADAALKTKFQDTMESAIVGKFGVNDEQVVVSLSQGSVVVQALVTLNDGAKLEDMADLRNDIEQVVTTKAQDTAFQDVWTGARSQISATVVALEALVPDVRSRPTARTCDTYMDDLGIAIGSDSHTVVMALKFGDDATKKGKRQWLLNIGQSGSGAEHWLYTPQSGAIQFGTWNGHQIQDAVDISQAQTLATVYDAERKTYALYIDGVFAAEQSHVSLQISDGTLAVGDRNRYHSDATFDGCSYGVDLYLSALTAVQVQAASKVLLQEAINVVELYVRA